MIGQLINRFDSLNVTTVRTFNEVFPHSKLDTKEFHPDWEVEIGELFGTTRMIIVTPPDKEPLHTFIEMANDETYQTVLIKKRSEKKNKETHTLF
jgi:hypothetical protein